MKPLILPYNGKYPQIHPTARIAPNATITGDVVIGANTSVWFNAVIRGDVNKILIGSEVNIQDNVVIHSTRGRLDTQIGDRTSIGHGAILHGCITEGDCLIGMAATILDDATIQPNTIIAANAMVPMKMVCQSNSIYGGTPAKKIKDMDEHKVQFYVVETAKAYIKYSDGYPSFHEWKSN